MSKEQQIANLSWFAVSVVFLWWALEFVAWPAIKEWRKSKRRRR